MTDSLSPKQRSLAMARVKLKNGPLELLVQKELQKRGIIFTCHCKDLPGTPDIVCSRERVVIFIDGDFWHGYRLPVWEHKLTASWREKLTKNRRRDLRNFRKLRSKKWKVVRIWEHQIKKDFPRTLERLSKILSPSFVVRTDSSQFYPDQGSN